jgi:hypothetical protein
MSNDDDDDDVMSFYDCTHFLLIDFHCLCREIVSIEPCFIQ